MDKKVVYKIMFISQGKTYEIYAQEIFQSQLFGFIEAEELVFGETTTVVDPAEERLRTEFKDVVRTYIPMQSIIRIDEVESEGVGKVSSPVADKGQGHNVMQFPLMFYSQNE